MRSLRTAKAARSATDASSATPPMPPMPPMPRPAPIPSGDAIERSCSGCIDDEHAEEEAEGSAPIWDGIPTPIPIDPYGSSGTSDREPGRPVGRLDTAIPLGHPGSRPGSRRVYAECDAAAWGGLPTDHGCGTLCDGANGGA